MVSSSEVSLRFNRISVLAHTFDVKFCQIRTKQKRCRSNFLNIISIFFGDICRQAELVCVRTVWLVFRVSQNLQKLLQFKQQHRLLSILSNKAATPAPPLSLVLFVVLLAMLLHTVQHAMQYSTIQH